MEIALQIAMFAAAGFLAQIIDGALGMAYGVSSTTFLLALGVPPAAASASVHAAEVITTGVSGLSHLRLGNVKRRLALRLLVPGVAGAVVGAYILTRIPGDVIRPFIAVYLAIMGIVILVKAIQGVRHIDHELPDWEIIPLGVIGGFFDALGGGGWGPIVTSTLVARGNHPRFTIGSVNFAEFFVTTSQVATFVLTIGLGHWPVIVGLMIGGTLAAPMAALVSHRIPARTLMLMVGVLIIGLSIRTIIQVVTGR